MAQLARLGVGAILIGGSVGRTGGVFDVVSMGIAMCARVLVSDIRRGVQPMLSRRRGRRLRRKRRARHVDGGSHRMKRQCGHQ